MKTFFNLIQEVQNPGLCHRCGGCVTFCTAVNYGALELSEEGIPRYGEIEKCIECGLCYTICPEIDEMEEETKRLVSWSAPIGRVLENSVARSREPEIRNVATDGGLVTSILLHLFETGKIDGAIVTRQINQFQREPFLALSKEDIISSAGFHFDTSHGMKSFSDRYLTFSSIEELRPMMAKGLRRVAFVGTPCQIKSIRKMQALEIVPSEVITHCLGLFCSGNFVFGEEQRKKLAEIGEFSWDNVVKINIKDDFQVHLRGGRMITIPLDKLDFMKREACRFCSDYSAEFADLSFGGVGVDEGWTNVLARTPLGRAVFADARGKTVEEFSSSLGMRVASQALERVLHWSEKKREMAVTNRQELRSPSVKLKE